MIMRKDGLCMSNMPERRKQILVYVIKYIEENNYPPSYRDISAALDIPSTSTVAKELTKLIDEGYLEKDPKNYRSICTVQSKIMESFPELYSEFSSNRNKSKSVSEIRNDVYDIPVYGDVAAGAPILATDEIEDTIPLPSSFFPNDQARYFVLKIKGDSMIEIGIFDGDNVIVKRQNVARNGQQVVALIEDSATVKTFFQRQGYVELRPENSEMEPIIVKECSILGIVVGLYRLF